MQQTPIDISKKIMALKPDLTKCSYCNGHGNVEYMAFSKPYRRNKICPLCGGSGKTIDWFKGVR